MPKVDRVKIAEEEAQALQGATVNDAFDYIIDDTDTITVSVEVYPVEQGGKRYPKILDRESIMEARRRLVDERGLMERKRQEFKDNNKLTYEEDLEITRALAFIDESLKTADINLSRATTTITATFQRPGFKLDGAITRESRIEVYGKAPEWDEHTHILAVLRNLLKSWDLKQRKPDGSMGLIPISSYEKVDGDILAALVIEFKKASNYGLVNEEQSKNA